METLLFRFVDVLIKAIEQHKGFRVKMWSPLLLLQIEQTDYVSSRVKKLSDHSRYVYDTKLFKTYCGARVVLAHLD